MKTFERGWYLTIQTRLKAILSCGLKLCAFFVTCADCRRVCAWLFGSYHLPCNPVIGGKVAQSCWRSWLNGGFLEQGGSSAFNLCKLFSWNGEASIGFNYHVNVGDNVGEAQLAKVLYTFEHNPLTLNFSVYVKVESDSASFWILVAKWLLVF